MAQLSSLAPTYIENNKARLLNKYYAKHSEGAVILLFNRDGSCHQDYFMTKSEIQFSSALPSNAYSEAQEYWINNPEQLTFLSWFYPITLGTSFNVYCLGTVIKTFNVSTYNQPPVFNEPSNYTPKQDSESNGNGFVLFFCGGFFILGVIAMIASLANGDFGGALSCLLGLLFVVVSYPILIRL